MASAVGGASNELHALVSRDAVSGAGKAGAYLGKKVAKAFGGGKRKQAEYAAGGARLAEGLTTKYMPKVKAKLREYGGQLLRKGLSYAKFKRGGRVKRRRYKMGGKVRSQFHFKH